MVSQFRQNTLPSLFYWASSNLQDYNSSEQLEQFIYTKNSLKLQHMEQQDTMKTKVPFS